MHPINKKYFGNRNVGSLSTTTDNKIGGEGVASFGTIVAGSGWTTNPDPYFSAPTLPGGVTVTGTVHYKALSFDTTANGTGYDVGNVLEVHTGTATTKARAPVAEVITVNVQLANSGGSDYEAGNTITMSGAGWSTNLVITVTGVNGGGAITTFTVSNGRRTAAVPANPVSGTTAQGGGTDANGTGATFNLTWGVYSFGTVSVAGDYTGFPSTSGQLDSVSPATGTGATATITMGLLSVAVTEKGSGYVPADTDTLLQFDENANGASAVAVLTTDSGSAGSATNQENAIVIYANTDDNGAKAGDIIKQVSGFTYKVKTADGTRQKCLLVADSNPDDGEAYIQATDANGNTYFVTKLTSRVATLVRWTNNEATWLFADGGRAKWTFDGSPDNDQVTIENA